MAATSYSAGVCCPGKLGEIDVRSNPIKHFRIMTGKTGEDIQRFKVMLWYIMADRVLRDPKFLALDNEILSRATVHNHTAEIKRIESWLQDSISYRREYKERIQAPMVTLELGVGDCDDFAIIANAMAEGIGLETRFVFIKLKGGRGWHVYLEISPNWGKTWTPIDPSMPQSKKGYNIDPSRIETKLVLGRKEVQGYAIPSQIVARLMGSPDDVIQLEGGALNGMQLDLADVELLPDDTGALFKKLAAGIKKKFPKIISGVGKLAKSPLGKMLATAIPGGAAVLSVAGKAAEGLAKVMPPEKVNEIMAKTTALVDKAMPGAGTMLSTALTGAKEGIPALASALRDSKGNPLMAQPPSKAPVGFAALTQAMAGKLGLSDAQKKQCSCQTTATTKAFQRIGGDNTLLDALGSPQYQIVIDTMTPGPEKDALVNAISKRKAAVDKAVDLTAEKFSKVLITGNADVPELKAYTEKAIDADRLAVANSIWLDNIQQRLFQLPDGPGKSDLSLNYMNLKDQSNKISAARTAWIEQAMSRVGNTVSKGQGDVVSMGDLRAGIIGRNMSDTLLLLAATNPSRSVWDIYRIKLEDIQKNASSLNNQLNTMRMQVGA